MTQNSPHPANRTPAAPPLPEPGVKKTDAAELDRELDVAIEQSMDASDPPSVTLPDVKVGRQQGETRPAGGNTGEDAQRDAQRP